MGKEIDYKATAMNLRAIRMRKGYRARDVAEMMDVSPSCITHWELNDLLPGTRRLVQLADLYGVTIDSLIIRRTT